MGGTFDPIHYGHLLTAEEALQQFSLDTVIFVPTGQPWMKEHEKVSPAEDRYLMTVIATASNPRFRVSRVEVDREGATYTIDTLRSLKDEHGPTPTCSSSPAATRSSRSSSGRTRRSCSSSRTSSPPRVRGMTSRRSTRTRRSA